MEPQVLLLSVEQTADFFADTNRITLQAANFVLDNEDNPNTWSEHLQGYDSGRLQGIVEVMNLILGTEVSAYDVLDHFRSLR